jgi:hypothetical protein
MSSAPLLLYLSSKIILPDGKEVPHLSGSVTVAPAKSKPYSIQKIFHNTIPANIDAGYYRYAAFSEGQYIDGRFFIVE